MAGTTGLEPATSDVTDLHSGPVKSLTCLCYLSLRVSGSDTDRHKTPQNDTSSSRLLHAPFCHQNVFTHRSRTDLGSLPTPSYQERQRVPDYRRTKFRTFSQSPIPKTLLYLRIPVEP